MKMQPACLCNNVCKDKKKACKVIMFVIICRYWNLKSREEGAGVI